jgi:hypothetical protein
MDEEMFSHDTPASKQFAYLLTSLARDGKVGRMTM